LYSSQISAVRFFFKADLLEAWKNPSNSISSADVLNISCGSYLLFLGSETPSFDPQPPMANI